ncbi:MAG: formyltransferase family protein [Halieaceae bacterium]
MRITFLVNLDLYSNYALNLLLPALSEHHELTVRSSSHVGSAHKSSALDRLAFFEQTLPNQVIFPILDRSEQRGELLTFTGLTRYLKTPICPLEEPNTEIGLRALQATQPDLIVSIRYGRILHAAAIAIARLGVLNLHSGKLPEYRGVMATFRAMLNADDEIFSTVHWITDDSIDSGPIISQQGVWREPTSCYLGNVLSLYESGCPALARAITALTHEQTLPSTPPCTQGSYYSYPTQRHIDHFQSAGHEWADPRLLTRFLARYHAL